MWHCSAPEVKKFQEELQEEPKLRGGQTSGGGRPRGTPNWRRKRPEGGVDEGEGGEGAEEWELQ